MISPKRSTAASLKKQTAAVQAQIAANRSTAFQQALPAVRSASVFALTQAMPNKLDTPDVILTLNQLAHESGLSFDQISPQPRAATSTDGTTDPFAVEPITVKFSGSYYSLLTFLQRVRNLVRVQNGKLFTAGRLFDVSGVSFAAGPAGLAAGQRDAHHQRVRAAVGRRDRSGHDGHPTDTTSTTTPATTTPVHVGRPEHERRNLMKSRKKRMEDIRVAKDKKMKKVAIGLGVVFVAVLAFEVLPMVMHKGGGSAAAAPAATTTPPLPHPRRTAPATRLAAPATTPAGRCSRRCHADGDEHEAHEL